ncbi:hypothetical protein AB0N17_45750 [Streptomyces sp. NPDC051133]|uniref:hypothetical protein n=1 Tax=Streptomyces sp. NPDC051133 TaxID=3155521 RepID=UPI0034392F60
MTTTASATTGSGCFGFLDHSLLSSGMVVVMLVLTPYLFRLRDTSWTMGRSAILAGCVVVLALLGLVEHLTVPERRPTPVGEPDS